MIRGAGIFVVDGVSIGYGDLAVVAGTSFSSVDIRLIEFQLGCRPLSLFICFAVLLEEATKAFQHAKEALSKHKSKQRHFQRELELSLHFYSLFACIRLPYFSNSQHTRMYQLLLSKPLVE